MDSLAEEPGHAPSEEVASPAGSVDKEDRLTRLPSELLHIIFDFLLARHEPDKAFFEVEQPWLFKSKTHLSRWQPLDALSATSKALRAELNSWAISCLTQYKGKNSTAWKLPKATSKQATLFNALRSRYGLLNWIDLHCIFCGKKSTRFAIMMNGFRCCAPCDKKEWPNKITKTNARAEFDLKDFHLLPQQHANSPAMQKLRENFAHGVPKIRYGTYMSSGVPTTMFMREDVRYLAEQHHPDLRLHLDKRKAKKEGLARNREARREAATKAKTAATAGRVITASASGPGSSAQDPQYIDDDV